MEKSPNSASPIHSAACDIWKIPDDSLPEILVDRGYEDEAVISYLSAVSPIYNALSRIFAQYSGLLLLAMQAAKPELSLDHLMHQSALDQLGEVGERLLVLKAPPAAQKHVAALRQVLGQLQAVARDMDALSAIRGEEARTKAIADIIRQLHGTQRLLIATAAPDANITPVDFSQGCCNCRQPGHQGSTSQLT